MIDQYINKWVIINDSEVGILRKIENYNIVGTNKTALIKSGYLLQGQKANNVYDENHIKTIKELK